MEKTEDLNAPVTKGDLQAGFETFAFMVKQGFDDMGKRFELVDRRFDAVDGRLQGIENRLSRHQEMIDSDKLNITSLDNRVVTIEQKVGLPIKPLKV